MQFALLDHFQGGGGGKPSHYHNVLYYYSVITVHKIIYLLHMSSWDSSFNVIRLRVDEVAVTG